MGSSRYRRLWCARLWSCVAADHHGAVARRSTLRLLYGRSPPLHCDRSICGDRGRCRHRCRGSRENVDERARWSCVVPGFDAVETRAYIERAFTARHVKKRP